MRIWKYIKSLNETLLVAVIATITLIPLSIWFSHQNSISKFKCPEKYESADEHLEAVEHWIRVTLGKNPGITLGKITELRYLELKKHKCGNFHWTKEEAMIDNALFILKEDISLMERQYKLSNTSKYGDTWLAHYTLITPEPDWFDPTISVFYFPLYSQDSNSNGETISTRNVADFFAQDEQDAGAII